MIDLLRSIWTSRDRSALLWSIVKFTAGAFVGASTALWLLW